MVRARKPPDGRANNGGSRQGQQGKTYGNRSDLRQQKVSVPPSAEYGQGERLRRAQQAVPMAGAAPVGSPAPAGAPAPAASQGPMPGDLGDFLRPSERPGEPVTTGIAGGPGAGPEALSRPQADPELEALRPYLPTLELLASQPNASPSARMFVRRLRGSMPPPAGQ